MPKAYPDFEMVAERYLDGELAPAAIKKFEDRLKSDKELRSLIKEMKFARKAILIYKKILPSAKEFTKIRKTILARI